MKQAKKKKVTPEWNEPHNVKGIDVLIFTLKNHRMNRLEFKLENCSSLKESSRPKKCL
jgi:hypothetical protein